MREVLIEHKRKKRCRSNESTNVRSDGGHECCRLYVVTYSFCFTGVFLVKQLSLNVNDLPRMITIGFMAFFTDFTDVHMINDTPV